MRHDLEQDLATVSDDELEAASDLLDAVQTGTAYPPEGTRVGHFTVRYVPTPPCQK